MFFKWIFYWLKTNKKFNYKTEDKNYFCYNKLDITQKAGVHLVQVQDIYIGFTQAKSSSAK